MLETNEGTFAGKYRILSARLKNYDYSQPGAYFVTICTKEREHFFGKIENETISHSIVAKIAADCWQEIPNHFPFVELGAWVIMPNHVHGIIFINRSSVETLHATFLRAPKNIMSGISPQKFSLSSIVRSYKSAVSKEARKITPDFNWQPRFHDRIIRDEAELNHITDYIAVNSQNWENDDYF